MSSFGGTLRLAYPIRPFRKQFDAIRWRSEKSRAWSATAPDKRTADDIPLDTIALFGGYASGKTTTAAAIVYEHALSNPWRPEYGNEHPRTVIVAPTHKNLKDATFAAFRKLLNPQLIRKESKSDMEILLTNGHLVMGRSDGSSIEGLTLTGILVDEVALVKKADFDNYAARLRDPLVSSRLLMVVSGLPIAGDWQEEQFKDNQDPNTAVFHFSAYDNPNIPKQSLVNLRRRVVALDAETLIDGQWMKVRDLVVPEFDRTKHIRNDVRYDASLPVYIGIDPGRNTGHALIGQMRGRELWVIDEVRLSPCSSLEALSEAIKKRGYTNVKRIAPDPSSRGDEINSLRRVFGGSFNLDQPRHMSDEASEEYTIACIRLALNPTEGEPKLFFANHLRNNENGVIHAISNYKRKKESGRTRIEDGYDHAFDALRYLVRTTLPITGGFAPMTIPTR